MKYTSKILSSVAIAALLLQGCSNGDEQNSNEEGAALEQTQTPTPYVSSDPEGAARSANALLGASKSTQNILDEYEGSSYKEAIKKLKLDVAGGAIDDETLKTMLIADSDADAQAFMMGYLKEVQAENSDISDADIEDFLASTDLNELFLQIMQEIDAEPTKSFLFGGKLGEIKDQLTDKVKDALVDVLDTDLGNQATGAVFDVVLESDEVTVFMLDQARNSETVTQIMIDALGNNWDLTKKMCPKLQTNKEFGEKFAALAEERDILGSFFFEMIDAPLYGCLTDAMLLSNDESNHHEEVSHSTTEYMGILMKRYSRYFILPNSDSSNTSGYGRNDAFVNLLFATGEAVDYNRSNKTFAFHGDGNELSNEKLFYALFKTPTSTDNFVAAMEDVNVSVRRVLMDHIFLGVQEGKPVDEVQGYLNILAIGAGMYEGIYGSESSPAYGFGSYTSAFIGFVGLIPGDRYMAYASAMISAGYEYALFNGIDVWDNVVASVEDIWSGVSGANAIESNATTMASAAYAPALSAGAGIYSTNWVEDVIDLFYSAWSNISLGALFDSLIDGDKSVLDELTDQADVAYHTVLDGTDGNGTKLYSTTVQDVLGFGGDTVYGFHGLVELAIQEDLVNTGAADNLEEAKTMFILPPFSQITWGYVYNSAVDGVTAYWDNEVNAQWLADLSDNELVKEYFYPSAYGIYIPSWMLAIDWLKAPRNYQGSDFAGTDFSFQSGYLDVYLVSDNADLITDANVSALVESLKDVSMEKVEMGDDTIIAVDVNGQDLNGLYVYKIRIINPDDVSGVINALYGLGEDLLAGIGLDTSNLGNVVDGGESNTTVASN